MMGNDNDAENALTRRLYICDGWMIIDNDAQKTSKNALTRRLHFWGRHVRGIKAGLCAQLSMM